MLATAFASTQRMQSLNMLEAVAGISRGRRRSLCAELHRTSL
jgi:hypothetical protein